MIHTLTLTYNDETGQLGLEGAPNNKVLAFGILQSSIALLTKQLSEPQQSAIVKPQIALVRPQ